MRFLVGIPAIFAFYKLLNRKEFLITLWIIFWTWAVFGGWLGIAFFRGGS
jgi:hypothetical protein